jgi:tripartite-type tricarboxylate transporter receptor subunit TctC
LTGELFKMMAGVNMVHVPYRGTGPALNDLLGGQVQVTFAATALSIEYPDIPTVGEFVPGYEAYAWFGVGAPKATPAEIVEKLNKAINASLADPKTKARFADLGSDTLALSSADFVDLIADETKKWGKVIRAAGIKAQ